MSSVAIRAAMESALNGMSPSLATAWENTPYTPTPGTAYQRVHLLLADPEMVEMSGRIHRERGLLQVTLCYPTETGPNAAQARAELIRSTFYAGAEFTAGGITVRVEKTPEIAPAMIENDTYETPVRIRFYAFVTRS